MIIKSHLVSYKQQNSTQEIRDGGGANGQLNTGLTQGPEITSVSTNVVKGRFILLFYRFFFGGGVLLTYTE